MITIANTETAPLPGTPTDKMDWPWVAPGRALPPTMPNGQPWPRITVVTPSYNQARFIEETLRSVLLQGYPNLEYIVMDGGSTDGSAEIIARYAPQLAHWQSARDGGQSAAISAGFARATGEIIAWLNSDDRYRPNTLARVAWFFARRPKLAFAGGDINRIDADGKLIQRVYAVEPNRFLMAHTGKHNLSQPACFWRRSAYELAGGVDPSLRFCMDRDLFLRLWDVGPAQRIPGSPLADFRIHEDAKSSTILDVHSAESAMLIDRYGTSPLRGRKALLEWAWRWWYRPSSLRRRLNQRFGWEL